MAAPVDAARATTNITAAASPWTVNLPGSIAAGDLLVMLVEVANGRVPSATGWALLDDDSTDASGDEHAVLTRVADGSEGATVSVALAGGTGKGAAIVYRVTGARTSGTIATFAKTANVGANQDPPSAATDGGASSDVLSIVFGSVDGETQTFSAAPSSYVNLATANSGTGSTPATNCVIGSASRQLTAVTSENPGAFTNSAPQTANGGTVYTILVHAPAGGGTTYEKAGSVTSGALSAGADVFTAAEAGSVTAAGRHAGADAFTAAEAGALTSSARAAGPDAFTAAEAGSLVASGRVAGADAFTAADAGSISAGARATGTDVLEAAETGSITAAAAAAGADVLEASRAGTVAAGALTAGADVLEAAEAGSLVAGSELSGVSAKEGGALTAAGSLVAGANVAGTDAFEAVESGALLAGGELRGAGILEAHETGTLTAGTFVAGPDSFQAAESGSVVAGAAVAGGRSVVLARAGSLYVFALVEAGRNVTLERSGSLVAGGELSGFATLIGFVIAGVVVLDTRAAATAELDTSSSSSVALDTWAGALAGR